MISYPVRIEDLFYIPLQLSFKPSHPLEERVKKYFETLNIIFFFDIFFEDMLFYHLRGLFYSIYLEKFILTRL